MLKRFIRTITAAAVGFFMLASALPASAATWITVNSGDLLKLPDDGNPETTIDVAVYYFGEDGLRYVFPNSGTYFTWYNNFDNVKDIGMEQLGTIGIGGNVTYRPGAKMIKIDSDPKTYAIDRGGARRHITSEAVAIALYGSNWNRQVHDMPDSFFSNYPEGQPILDAQDFQPTAASSSNPDVSTDKDLRAPVEVTLTANGFSPSSVTVQRGRTVRFTNQTNTATRVASNPHPLHNALPGFDAASTPAGLNYVYRFNRTGIWGYHHHQNTSQMGSVIVQ